MIRKRLLPTLIIIFIVEAAIMLVFSVIQLELSPWLHATIDAMVLALISAPLLYYNVIRPYVKRRDQAEVRFKDTAESVVDWIWEVDAKGGLYLLQ